ncbi:hypothetical protein DEIPH_ctg002orf0057 [Deinococcus phoenicis]|uniref:Uncharacterized protein n=1 Tax=Deinococcus phoenicis TaxID=1476583 RepID=A0A016QUD2_9DEIO|nr:hypothetical protein [Deinococcus phoenicis]EYB69735.1 hypothetical protein DEIPH_ctg002orf0057 [Deinococcus phoenicis]
MNEQLASTLALLTGGVRNIDPGVAVPRLRATQAALAGQPLTDMLAAQLGKVAELLEARQLTEAAVSIPPIAAEVENYARALPEEDRPPLMALAERLHLADGGPDA